MTSGTLVNGRKSQEQEQWRLQPKQSELGAMNLAPVAAEKNSRNVAAGDIFQAQR